MIYRNLLVKVGIVIVIFLYGWLDMRINAVPFY